MKASMLDIGIIEGKLLAFGGIYSNLQALEAMHRIAVQQNIAPQNIICTGDVVAYCAQPEACVQFVKSWGIHCIAGNMEIQLSSGQSDCACDFVDGGRCDNFSKKWYPYAQNNLSESALEWMSKLPEFIKFQYAGKEAAVVHGSFHNTSEFIFESTDWQVKEENFADTGADMILAGHCGLPFSQTSNEKYWLNPGVIGMPANDGTPRCWYMLLDDADEILYFTHHALEYDFATASDLMKVKDLPAEYAETLRSGIWDNCEILPPTETLQQGKALFKDQFPKSPFRVS